MPLHLQSLLGFSAWLVLFLIILNCSLLLTLDLINCGARLGPFLHLCLWLPRCWHLNWFVIFLAILQPSDSGPLLHQIISPWLLLTGRKADQNLSYFQTSAGAVAYVTLDTEQLISCLRVALVDTLSSLLNTEGGVIPVPEVCELLLKFHNILDNAVSQQVGTQLIS